MFLINCPFCGERDQSEFSSGGEAHIVRPKQPTELSDDEWAEYLFMRKNIKGVQFERWNHVHGCRKWFNVVRDTSNDKILSVYKMGEKPPVNYKYCPIIEYIKLNILMKLNEFHLNMMVKLILDMKVIPWHPHFWRMVFI